MHGVNDYIERVMSYIELNPTNKEDLKGELATHFQDKVNDYKSQGYDEATAIDKSKKAFGEGEEVGKELNRSFFPYRKPLLLLVSLMTVLFAVALAFTTYLAHEYIPFIWVTLVVLSSLLLLYFVKKPSRGANQRLFLIVLLVWQMILSSYGLLLMDGIQSNTLLYSLFVGVFAVSIILALSQIYLGVIYQPIELIFTQIQKQKRGVIMITTILTGIVVLGASLLYAAGLLIFSPESFVYLAIPIGLIVLWIAFVLGELKSRKHETTFRILKVSLSVVTLVLFLSTQFNF
ncbi:permease prefix domain 1-containing protein [Alkalihalophilus lindianensis]|uniref:Permease prefix domain 1-containing protein n=1 Tax=Alkalihalophilus lindianensis TaxID=1630542 RepID=A0ABU3X961_9BACI|nr:permease prefix domain 1-containing protein [Alkalihalophilus lindianensis]MDV2684427.1 permease prefix domain 1-containing protein [Alkalihalophilus lindianensis]